MAYLSPIHPASSVRHAFKLNFLDPDEECLVVAKANRLEIYQQTPEGLELKHSKALFGCVTVLNKIRPKSSVTDHLFVGTDRFNFFTLSWDSTNRQVRTERKYVDLTDKSSRDAQAQDRCHVDPTGKFLTLELYEGVFTIIPITQKPRPSNSDAEVGNLEEPLQTRIPEMFVRSSAFLVPHSESEPPRIALLHEDPHKRVRLQLRQLKYELSRKKDDPPQVDLEDVAAVPNELEMGASHIIPVPAPIHGLILLGEVSLAYYDDSRKKFMQRPLNEATIWTCWECIDSQRFILGDEYGKLYLLMLDLDQSNRVTGWKLDVLGITSKASVLSYLGQGRVFVGSHQGDSQVVAIKPKSVEVTQTLPNIAPIVDFTIMDMGNRSREGPSNEFSSGQARLVTGSGAFKDGSLRSLRSGVGLEDLGLLDTMENVTDLFSLRSNSSSSYADILLVTFVDETRAFKFDADGNIEELDRVGGLAMDQGTLHAANVGNDKILQIVRSEVSLLELDGGMAAAHWAPPEGRQITAFDCTDSVAVVCIGGSTLTLLDLQRDLAVRAETRIQNDSQVACLAIATTSLKEPLCIVGYWQSSSLTVHNLNDFSKVCELDLGLGETTQVPRSLLLAQVLEGDPLLFVALADGAVVTYRYHPDSVTFTDRKSTILGTQHVSLRAFPRTSPSAGEDDDGEKTKMVNIFAVCENPSFIYGSEGQLVFSAVTAEGALSVCPLDAEAYPGAVAIATKDDLKIAMVDEQRSTHVQRLHVGETVRRIAWSAELKAFGLGTIHRSLEDGAEIVQSHLKLADEVMFQVLDTFALNNDELIESVMRAELPDGSGGLAERFVAGTAYLEDETQESVRGRIIVFEVTEDRKIKLVVSHAVKGACRCLGMLDGKIVAGLIKTVATFALEYQSRAKPVLRKTSSFRTATAPIDLTISEDAKQIAVADLMKSLSLLQYESGEGGENDRLYEIARHYQTVWTTAVARIDESKFLESDAEGNLIVLERNETGVTDDDRRRLLVRSEMRLGEQVNKIRTIDLPLSPDAAVLPKAFLATVEGGVHLFSLIQPRFLNVLIPLQSAMAARVQSLGDIPFLSYRAFRNQVREEAEPNRFVDGELIEQFVDLPKAVQQQIVDDIPGAGEWDVPRLCEVVDSLRRLR